MGYIKRNWHFVGLLSVLLAVAVTAWAVAPEINPYGMATPRIYKSTYGDTHSTATYYAVPPTLSANDTIACLAATQTFTNKTLTAPTINTGTLTFPTVTGTASFAGGVTVDGVGTATMYGFKDTVSSVAAGTTIVTLATTDSGKVYYTPGRSGAAATGDVTINLPDAAAGLKFTVVVGSTGVATIIDPGAADQIILGTDAAGNAYSCATLGSTVTCEAVDVTNWAIVAEKGTWADGN